MKQERAVALSAEIERQYQGRIRASAVQRRRCKNGAGFVVSLYLVAGQRLLDALNDEELAGILDAWSVFFEEAS